jgi:hypothetical protein
MKDTARTANQQRFASRKGRVLTVAGRQWKVIIGSSGVKAYCEDGRHVTSTPWEIKGCTPDTFDRGQWKRTSDGAIFPSEIAEWLQNQTL